MDEQWKKEPLGNLLSLVLIETIFCGLEEKRSCSHRMGAAVDMERGMARLQIDFVAPPDVALSHAEREPGIQAWYVNLPRDGD